MKINPQLKEELKTHLNDQIQKEKERLLIMSAYTLSQKEIQAILSSFPELTTREYENVVDTSLMGGFVLRFGSKIVDLSIRTILQTFSKSIHETH